MWGGKGGLNWEAQRTHTRTVKSGSHLSKCDTNVRNKSNSTKVKCQKANQWNGSLMCEPWSYKKNFKQSLRVHPQEKNSTQNSTLYFSCVLILPTQFRVILPLAASHVQLDNPTHTPSSRSRLYFFKRSSISSLHCRSSSHIASQSEIKKFACHLLISSLSVKQPSKTCFPPFQRRKL
jgi:hypothetical protein